MNLPLVRSTAPGRGLHGEGRDLAAAAVACAEAAFAAADALDSDNSFPDAAFAQLHEAGLLAAPLATDLGGVGLGLDSDKAQLTLDVLSAIGWGSLPLGRLYEGHVNALHLVQTHGSRSQVLALAEDARRGLLFGVWNTQGPDGLALEADGRGFRLRGAKIFASGAGRVLRPLVTARRSDGALIMAVPRLDPREAADRADLSGWKAHGMRASASGAFDFTGVALGADDVLGEPDDYHLQPAFSAGAWRFCAVQLGGTERLLDCTRRSLADAGRASDPYQLMRIGQAATAAAGARLWVEAAARKAENPLREDSQALIAFVNLTRGAVERAALDVIELTQRSIGLAGFMRTHAVERVMRDLSTYLRQPAPDKALAEAAAHVLGSARPARDLWRR